MGKKKTNNKKKDQKRRQKQLERKQWESENADILSNRRKAPYLKTIFRSRGCELPFYDYLDSYEAEFVKLTSEYSTSQPSLVGIHEIENADLGSTEWKRFGGSAEWQQVFYDYDDDSTGTYGIEDKSATLKGNTVTLEDAEGGIHTLVRIGRSVKTRFRHQDSKYVAKIPALLHEIGHVVDIESRTNFDPVGKTVRIIDAEVFANLFALKQCVERGYRESLIVFLDTYAQYVDGNDYLAEVARRTLDNAPSPTDILDWHTLTDDPATPSELKMIGERGRRILEEG